MELKVRPRKWGNSIAIIIPKNIVDENNINTEEDTVVEFKKKATAKNLFGIFPRKKWKKSTEQIMKEVDKELWGIKR